jgi:hypothetical protein
VEVRACREFAALEQASEQAAAVGVDVELADLVDVRVDELAFGFELVQACAPVLGFRPQGCGIQR